MFEKEKLSVFPFEKKQSILEKISRRTQWIIIVSVLIILAIGGYFFFKKKMNIGSPDYNISSGVSDTSKSKKEKPDPKKEESVNVKQKLPFGGANYQSENFRVGDIAIGGEAEFLLTEDTPEPLEISVIRGEAFNEKNKQEIKLVLSWKTNKLAKSQIMYSKGVGQAEKTIDEDDYALNHSVIITGLDQSSTYIYTISSRDRFGNMAISDPYAVYTGSKDVSLFDLIADAMSEVFGWAISSR